MGQEYIRQIVVLGSVPNLGPVILSDDMEGLFKWTSLASGTPTFEKSTTVAYNGSASLHMKTRTADAAADDYCIAQRKTYQRPGKRYSVELLFYFAVLANLKSFDFGVTLFDGVANHLVGLLWDAVNSKWKYQSGLITYTDVPGGGQALLAAGWHRARLSFDENKKEYLSLESDGLLVPLTGLSYYSAASAVACHQIVQATIVSVAATPPEMWVDDVLVMEI